MGCGNGLSGSEKKLPGLRSTLLSLSPWHARSVVQASFLPQAPQETGLLVVEARRILRDARAVCFTTEEERRLGLNLPSLPSQSEVSLLRIGGRRPTWQRREANSGIFQCVSKIERPKAFALSVSTHPKKGLDFVDSLLLGRLS